MHMSMHRLFLCFCPTTQISMVFTSISLIQRILSLWAYGLTLVSSLVSDCKLIVGSIIHFFFFLKKKKIIQLNSCSSLSKFKILSLKNGSGVGGSSRLHI